MRIKYKPLLLLHCVYEDIKNRSLFLRLNIRHFCSKRVTSTVNHMAQILNVTSLGSGHTYYTICELFSISGRIPVKDCEADH
jgi:hypothetical protein